MCTDRSAVKQELTSFSSGSGLTSEYADPRIFVPNQKAPPLPRKLCHAGRLLCPRFLHHHLCRNTSTLRTFLGFDNFRHTIKSPITELGQVKKIQIMRILPSLTGTRFPSSIIVGACMVAIAKFWEAMNTPRFLSQRQMKIL
jgi:hypothetical protein